MTMDAFDGRKVNLEKNVLITEFIFVLVDRSCFFFLLSRDTAMGQYGRAAKSELQAPLF